MTYSLTHFMIMSLTLVLAAHAARNSNSNEASTMATENNIKDDKFDESEPLRANCMHEYTEKDTVASVRVV